MLLAEATRASLPTGGGAGSWDGLLGAMKEPGAGAGCHSAWLGPHISGCLAWGFLGLVLTGLKVSKHPVLVD